MTAVFSADPATGCRPGAFGNATHLVCRACGAHSPLGPFYACLECFGPLEVGYAYPTITRAEIEAGPKSIWRYAPLLPVPADIATFRSTDPGYTRLVDARHLADDLGLKQLWVKDDSGNPTHSFKDRVVAVALSAARELGLQVLACPSTGNLANAVAAAAARAGITSVVLVPSNLEGSKTLGYEIAEQLGWRLPDQVVIPVASGSQLTKIDKAFHELVTLGLVEDKPYKIFGAQATGCSPIAQAFRAGQDVVAPVRPDTIAKSLAIGNPADGPYVLDVTRRTGGVVADVDDDTVVENIQRLARTEGIFGETAV